MKCRVCCHQLKAYRSILRGIGPVCQSRMEAVSHEPILFTEPEITRPAIRAEFIMSRGSDGGLVFAPGAIA